ncbi:MAG TPA: NHLP bacteriocin system secretion protein, partial [Spirochaetota bacterium]|nr:NHLP bacteriocin system secretion protein [Spirochaetota bacterium]
YENSYLIQEKKRYKERLEQKLYNESNIISSYSGRVIEIMVNVGSIISPNDIILSLEPAGKDIKNLEALIYVSSEEGKKIKQGMQVEIVPSIIKREEFGYISGRVTSVSDYPATFQGMMKILANETVVKNLLIDGSVIAIHVDLIPSSKTYSKYKWSTGKGPNLQIDSGTICNGVVKIDIEKPITLVFPALKSILQR